MSDPMPFVDNHPDGEQFTGAPAGCACFGLLSVIIVGAVTALLIKEIGMQTVVIIYFVGFLGCVLAQLSNFSENTRKTNTHLQIWDVALILGLSLVWPIILMFFVFKKLMTF